MVRIVGFIKFSYATHLNSPIIAITKSITIDTHRQARFYFNKFMEVACVSLKECDFCFDFHNEVIRKIPPELRFNHHLYREFLIRLNPDCVKIPYQKTLVPPIFPHMLWRLGYLLLILNRIVKGKLVKHKYFDFDKILCTSNNWKKLIRETLLNGESLAYRLGYFNKDFIKKLIEAQYSEKNYDEKLAFLITFKLLLRIFKVNS